MPTLRVNGYEMAFVERGPARRSSSSTARFGDYRSWALQMEPFGARFRTIAVSLRHCWPERWDGGGDDFTVQQHEKDVAAFIAALGAGPVHLIGHSRGGHIAFRVAQHFPDRIGKLALVEPGGVLDASLEPPRPPKSPPMALGPLYAAAAERIRRGEVDEALAATIEIIEGPGAWANLPERHRRQMRDNARTLIGKIKEQRAPFSRADAEVIRAPTLLMAGERSPENFHRILDGLESALKDVRRVVIPNASHRSHVDNPKAFDREALAFLEE